MKPGLGAPAQTCAIAGGSTGDPLLDWVNMAASNLAATLPRTALNVLHWDDATQTYTLTELYHRRRPLRHEARCRHRLGLRWRYRARDWSLDGRAAVASADTRRERCWQTLARPAMWKSTPPIIAPVPSSGAPSVRIMAKYANNTNFLYFGLALKTSNVYSASVAGRDGWSSNTFKTVTGVNASADNTYR